MALYGYARPVGDGWVEINGPFTLPNAGSNEVLKDPNDPAAGTEVATYDLQFGPEWIECATPSDRALYGIKAILKAEDPPAGHRILGRTLITSAGKPKWQFVTEAIPLSERLAAILRAIDARRDELQAADFTYDFGETTAVDDFGTEIAAGQRALQMRAEDRQNWQALQSQAVVAVMAGQGAMTMPMRAEDNWNVQTTAAQVIEVTSAMVQRNATILFHGGAMKSAARRAVDEDDAAALDAIDPSAGWP